MDIGIFKMLIRWSCKGDGMKFETEIASREKPKLN